MSSYAIPYISQPDWWNQPVDNIHRLSISQHYRSDSVHAREHSLQNHNLLSESGLFETNHANDAYQSTQAIPNYWFNDLPQYSEPSMPFALLPAQIPQGDYANQEPHSASLPPAAFSKEPLPIDQFSTNDLTAFNSTTPDLFFQGNNQVLSVSDVPALEYDSTSDETAYGRRQWTDSPTADEIDSLATSGDADDSLENSDPCYAELLRQALMEKKPDHTMLLKDLYEWVRTHSSKAQDPSNKGWQNSVRHNLSMNAAFERVPPPNQEAGTKKTSYWRLTQDAVEHGISSTTRYRKDSKRKTQRNPNPALIRVQAGAKGGQATRRSVRRQRMAASCSSPLNSSSPASDTAHQRSLRQPHQLRDFLRTQVDASSSQQRPSQATSTDMSTYFGNTTDMFQNMYSADSKIDENRDFLAPYGTVQSYLDWSVSPSPIGQASHETGGWRMDPNSFGI